MTWLMAGLIGYGAVATAYAARLHVIHREELAERNKILGAVAALAQPLDAPLLRGIVEPADAVARGTRETVASLSRKPGLP